MRSVGLIDDIDEVGPNHAGAFLLLTRAGSGAVSTYRFDVGVRRAAENDVSVLVLGDPGGPDPHADGACHRSPRRHRAPSAVGTGHPG